MPRSATLGFDLPKANWVHHGVRTTLQAEQPILVFARGGRSFDCRIRYIPRNVPCKFSNERIACDTAFIDQRAATPPVGRLSLQRQRNRHFLFSLVVLTTSPLDLRGASDAMVHSPLYHVVFCVVGIMVLKEVNSVVTEPYMVCAVLPVTFFLNQAHVARRTNHSMRPRPKRTAKVNGPPGIRRLPPLLDCAPRPTHVPRRN